MVNRTDERAAPAVTGPARRTDAPIERWAPIRDAALALGAFGIVVFVIPTEPGGELTTRALREVPVGELITITVASAALWWRRSHPLVVLAVAMSAMVLSQILDWSELDGLVTFVALYNVGRHVGDDRHRLCSLPAVADLGEQVLHAEHTRRRVSRYLFDMCRRPRVCGDGVGHRTHVGRDDIDPF